MNKMSLLKASLILVIASSAFSAKAALYKWVDENGVTQYTQMPPSGDVKVETIKPPPKIDTEAARRHMDEMMKKADMLEKARVSVKEKTREAGQEVEARKDGCKLARARLASYQRPRVNKVLADGTRVRISEQERLAEIAKSEQLVKKLCSQN